MKKNSLIIFIVLILLFSLSVYSFPQNIPEEYKFEVELHPGWNLLPEPLLDFVDYDWDIMDQDDVDVMKDFSNFGPYRFLYLPKQKEYFKISFVKNPPEKQNLFPYYEEGYIHFTPSWFYFKGDDLIYLKANVAELEQYSDRDFKIVKGWNLVTVTPHFWTTKELGMGDCDISKVYVWDSQNQEWESTSVSELFFDDDINGYSVALKANNNCEFERKNKDSEDPPSLPGFPVDGDEAEPLAEE
ncbi:hypothetical protein HN695_05845 [Candidatus Woesearchaeota archaeon]|jgi:hypothetical protein|nr:hypothetical protein [Candidatus Woesearchaeota archaeon]MBT5272596.1 hypothetical protein [Candidatus Woesearchaeota archaeon]MBT6040547.1 hypothetical protein [Candidatus Woesearchaeota archaeon]MBT6337148.1 hypothetical protein [Candidatus Woesearchaeota archaeon]MBT7927832.1 hypothetical protein [Candidatus Woesearchaeota archaeon]